MVLSPLSPSPVHPSTRPHGQHRKQTAAGPGVINKAPPTAAKIPPQSDTGGGGGGVSHSVCKGSFYVDVAQMVCFLLL